MFLSALTTACKRLVSIKIILPIAAATTNKAFGCFLRAGIHRKAIQLHRFPTVPRMRTVMPTSDLRDRLFHDHDHDHGHDHA